MRKTKIREAVMSIRRNVSLKRKSTEYWNKECERLDFMLTKDMEWNTGNEKDWEKNRKKSRVDRYYDKQKKFSDLYQEMYKKEESISRIEEEENKERSRIVKETCK